MKTFLIAAAVCFTLEFATAAESARDILQKGFFEEEANQNIEGAIQAYQTLIRQADEERKIVASAMFRLAECYRKLGRTNDAVAMYQRVAVEPGEEALKRLSQQNLAALGAGPSKNADSGVEDPEMAEIRRYQRILEDSPDLLNALNEQGRAPLHRAALSGQVAVVKFLLDSGAMVDRKTTDNSTALHYAAGSGYKAIAELLLDRKAGLNEPGGAKWTALHWAAAKGHRAMSELLVGRGADLEAVAHKKNNSPVAPQNYSIFGGSPLHLAVEHQNLAVAEFLLEKGANPNAPSMENVTPLMVASQTGSLSMIRLLARRQADANARDSHGQTPLHWAARERDETVVRELLDAGAEVNATNNSGATPLLGALIWPKNVALMLRRGANPNIIAQGNAISRFGETAIDRLNQWNRIGNELAYEESLKLVRSAGGKTAAQMWDENLKARARTTKPMPSAPDQGPLPTTP